MPPTLHFHLVYTGFEDYARVTHPGVVILSSGDLICGHQIFDGVGDVQMDFLGSSDGGETWAIRSQLIGGQINPQVRMAHLPGNVLLYPGQEVNNNESKIFRSIDGANSWTMVHDFNPSGFVNKAYQVQTITAYGRGSALAYGALAHAVNDGFNSSLARSTDGGATWTLENNTVNGNMNTQWRGISPGGNGFMIANQYRDGFWMTDDNGVNWSGPLSLTLPPDCDEMFSTQTTWITPEIVLASGDFLTSLNPRPAALYRSTDAGSTWNIVATADIENWPGGSAGATIYSLARLTRDGALLGWQRNTLGPTVPLRYSIDAGATWLEPTTDSYSWTDANAQATGATVVTPAGRIIVSLPTRRSGTWEHNIWSGEIIC